MTAMPPLRDILNNTPANAIDVDFNFNTIEAHIGAEVVNRDGSVAMTGPLSTQPPTAPQHAATKAYIDSFLPVGMITPYAGQIAPAGWALCDGSQKSTTDPAYAALFAVVGYLYGGSGGNFNLPDLLGRIPVGKWTGNAAIDAVGKKTGSYDAPIVNHTHGLAAHTHAMKNHSHAMQNHQHYMNHQHDLSNHQHLSPARAGYDMNSAGQAGTTNAIYTPSGTPLTFITRKSALMQSQEAGPATDWTGTPNNNMSSYTRDWTDGPNNNTTTGPNDNTTDAASGNTADANAAVSATNRNIQPCTVVNYIIRIG